MIPFRHAVARFDAVLRGRSTDVSRQTLADLAVALVICGVVYGSIMGTSGGRPLQVVYSAVKVPVLLVVAFGLGLPSYFVLHNLLGVRDDFARVLRSLVLAQAVLTVVLAALAPLVVLFYASVEDHEARILFNALVFAGASFASQLVLRREYRPLIAKDRVHRKLLRMWLLTYAFVGVQLAWVMRPFVGDPGRPTQFFRDDAWSNAYVWLARSIWRQLS
jgi:hypothetical protein